MEAREEKEHYQGGYWYPVDVARIMDPHDYHVYIVECVERARLHADSARNKMVRRAGKH